MRKTFKLILGASLTFGSFGYLSGDASAKPSNYPSGFSATGYYQTTTTGSCGAGSTHCDKCQSNCEGFCAQNYDDPGKANCKKDCKEKIKLAACSGGSGTDGDGRDNDGGTNPDELKGFGILQEKTSDGGSDKCVPTYHWKLSLPNGDKNKTYTIKFKRYPDSNGQEKISYPQKKPDEWIGESGAPMNFKNVTGDGYAEAWIGNAYSRRAIVGRPAACSSSGRSGKTMEEVFFYYKDKQYHLMKGIEKDFNKCMADAKATWDKCARGADDSVPFGKCTDTYGSKHGRFLRKTCYDNLGKACESQLWDLVSQCISDLNEFKPAVSGNLTERCAFGIDTRNQINNCKKERWPQ